MSGTSVVFIGGFLTAGYFVVGLIFLRFWSRTRDTLFVSFAIAFWLMAANQAAAVLLGLSEERQAVVYLLRLAAFALIIGAIVRKNLRSPRDRN